MFLCSTFCMLHMSPLDLQLPNFITCDLYFVGNGAFWASEFVVLRYVDEFFDSNKCDIIQDFVTLIPMCAICYM